MFAEHQGLGDWMSSPVSKLGGRVELDHPIVGDLLHGYVAGELAADHSSGSWQPEVGASAGVRISF